MGINDSEELWQKQIIETGGGINDVELVRTLVSSATGTGKWLEDMGVKWLPMVYEAWSGEVPSSSSNCREKMRDGIHSLPR